MNLYRTIPIILTMLVLSVSISDAISDEEMAEYEKTAWTLDIKLDMPELAPAAVMWALFDENPIPAYKESLVNLKDIYNQLYESENDEEQLPYIQQAQLKASWSTCFIKIPGDKIYLLTSVLHHSLTSKTNPGKRWIVTRLRFIDGEPICWMIPIELEIGSTIEVVLSKENMFDLTELFNSVIER